MIYEYGEYSGHIAHDSGVDRPRIRQLPEEVVRIIAAGEVIESPASVVKELVENSIDAAASSIRVDVKGGGLAHISVVDDGVGIAADELPVAIQRHATSKLPEGRLDAITTLGFRGEALPSIAAVSELTITSSAKGENVGRSITVRDGKVVADHAAPASGGTVVVARHLFRNVPARLAMVDKPHVEVGHISQVLRRLYLSSPHVALRLYSEGKMLLSTSGQGDRLAALIELYGGELEEHILDLGIRELRYGRYRLILSDSAVTRPSRHHINIVVNNRWAQVKALLASMEQAYRGILPKGRHPILLLQLDLDPSRLDVNVHPAKQEVKLLDEREVIESVCEQLRSALGKNPSASKSLLYYGIEPFPSDYSRLQVAEERESWSDEKIVTPNLPPVKVLAQLHDRLIVLEGDEGLYLVDQHRAHERVLYERFLTERMDGFEALLLSEPVVIELRTHQVQKLAEYMDELSALGFECEVFGRNALLVRAMPDPGKEIGDHLTTSDLLWILQDEPSAFEDPGNWKHRLITRMACRMAVRRGKSLEHDHMVWIVERLGHTSVPAICPHGSPIIRYLPRESLYRDFEW